MKHILHPHRRRGTGFIDTTVYRLHPEFGWQKGEDKPFSAWWPAPKNFTDSVMDFCFSADLPDMTPQDAAAQLRRIKEEQGK